jgi:hypothetical protein
VEKAQRNWKTMGSSPPSPISSRRLWQQATKKQDKETMRMVDLLWPALNFQTGKTGESVSQSTSFTVNLGWIHTSLVTVSEQCLCSLSPNQLLSRSCPDRKFLERVFFFLGMGNSRVFYFVVITSYR